MAAMTLNPHDGKLTTLRDEYVAEKAKPDLEKDFQLLSTLKAEIEKTEPLALAWDEGKERFDARKENINDRLSVAVAAEDWDGAEKIKEELLILPPTVEEFIDFEAEESRRERERKAREEEERKEAEKLKSRTLCVKCNHRWCGKLLGKKTYQDDSKVAIICCSPIKTWNEMPPGYSWASYYHESAAGRHGGDSEINAVGPECCRCGGYKP